MHLESLTVNKSQRHVFLKLHCPKNERNICPSRGVVPGGAGGAMAPQDFGRSVNPISTRWDKLCTPNYYWHPPIFRPSDGPA